MIQVVDNDNQEKAKRVENYLYKTYLGYVNSIHSTPTLAFYCLPALAALVNFISRYAYGVFRTDFLLLLLLAYIYFGLRVSRNLSKGKVSIQQLSIYYGGSFAITTIFLYAIIIREFIVVNNVTFTLLGVVTGILLTILATLIIIKVKSMGISRSENIELQQNQLQRTQPKAWYYFAVTSSGFLGMAFARFIFENYLPEEIGSTLGFKFGLSVFIYFFLVLVAILFLYDTYLIRKYGLIHLKV